MKFFTAKVKSALARGAAAGILVFAAYRLATAGAPLDVGSRAACMAAEALSACFLAFVNFYLGFRFALIYSLFLALELAAALLCRMRVGVCEFICLGAFPAVAALAAWAAPRRGAGLRRLPSLLCAALTLCASLQYGIYIAYILRYGGRPSTMGMTMVLVTNFEEAWNFLFDQFGAAYVLLAAIIAFGSAWAALRLSRAGGVKRGAAVWPLLALAAVLAFGAASKSESYSMLALDIKHAVRQSRFAREAALGHRKRPGDAASLRPVSRGGASVCVVVIGESANRAHHAVFGYDRPTTPWLSSAPVILFKNAYSCMVQTGPAVTMALSRFNNYDPRARTGSDELLTRVMASLSLPELLRAAGVKTIWLSNQHSAGAFDSPGAASVAMNADRRHFLTDDPAGPDGGGVHADGELVPLLREALEELPPDADAVVFLHLRGSHWRYSDHAPADWPYLPRAGRLDALEEDLRKNVEDYDRSVSYTDWVLGQVVQTLQKSKFPVSSMLYFADHSEDVLTGRAHNYDALTPAMTTIPAAFWCSEDYRKRWPETVARLSANKDRVFTNDLAFELICGIVHVTFDGLDERFQLTSPRYAVTPGTARFWQGRLLKEIVPELAEQ